MGLRNAHRHEGSDNPFKTRTFLMRFGKHGLLFRANGVEPSDYATPNAEFEPQRGVLAMPIEPSLSGAEQESKMPRARRHQQQVHRTKRDERGRAAGEMSPQRFEHRVDTIEQVRDEVALG